MTTKPQEPSYDIHDLLEELRGESDRAAAIVGVAWLDDLLLRVLRAFLVEGKETDRLLGFDGGPATLSSFALRAKLAYCLGLLSADQERDLLTIANIRNHFAHKIHRSSFSNHKIRDLCLTLKQGPLVLSRTKVGDPREVFLATVSIIAYSLANQRDSLEHRSPVQPPSLRDLQRRIAAAFYEGAGVKGHKS